MPNRPGRPPLADGDPSVGVQVRLPGKEYDAVYARAQRERISVPEVIRRAIARVTRREDERDE